MAKKPRSKRGPRPQSQLPHDPNPGPAVKPGSPADTGAVEQPLKTEKPSARSSRMTAQQRYKKNQRDMKLVRASLGIIALALVAIVGYGVWQWADDRSLNQKPEGVQSTRMPSADHTGDVLPFSALPPMGGPHDPVWQNCGYYAEPIRTENAVHSMEHGAIWIAYRPDLPADQVAALKSLAEEQDYILVSPYPELASPVVATSWNNQLQLDDATDTRLRQFVRVYKQGPDTPEPGASCSGGTNATVPA
jgi:hypothetical protein